MTSTEAYTTAVHQGRSAVERSADLWQQSTRALTGQTVRLWQLPQPDFAEAIGKYFEYLQDGLEVNKDVTVKWVGALTSITEALRDQLQTVTDFQRGHSRAISTWISGETETFQHAAEKQAEQIDKAQRQQLERARRTTGTGRSRPVRWSGTRQGRSARGTAASGRRPASGTRVGPRRSCPTSSPGGTCPRPATSMT